MIPSVCEYIQQYRKPGFSRINENAVVSALDLQDKVARKKHITPYEQFCIDACVVVQERMGLLIAQHDGYPEGGADSKVVGRLATKAVQMTIEYWVAMGKRPELVRGESCDLETCRSAAVAEVKKYIMASLMFRNYDIISKSQAMREKIDSVAKQAGCDLDVDGKREAVVRALCSRRVNSIMDSDIVDAVEAVNG